MSHRIKKYKNTDNLFYIQKEMINFVAISREKKNDAFKSILIGIGVGIIWGGINYLLMKGNNAITPANLGKAFPHQKRKTLPVGL